MNHVCRLFAWLTVTLLLFACSKPIEKEYTITVTIEPQRYFAEQLADTLYEIKTMVPPGASPENYDPTPQQMAQLAQSIAYFQMGYLGFENVWLNQLKQNNPGVSFFNNGNGIDYICPGAHAHNHSGHEGEKIAWDPHTWSSPQEALQIVNNMYQAMLDIDPENRQIYSENYSRLVEEIKGTDREIRNYLNTSSQKGFIIYHPALTYFARDYGLVQSVIEMDGKEPSPAQLKQLIDTAKEHRITTLFIQEEFDKKNAEIVAAETGCKVVVINPLSYRWKDELIRIAKALSDE